MEKGYRATAKEHHQKIANSIFRDIDREISYKFRYERKINIEKERGNGTFIMNGSDDRVMGDFCHSKDKTYSTDSVSYLYGYYVHGQKRIEAIIYNLLKEDKHDEVKKIGYREYNLGISEFGSNGKLSSLFKYRDYVEGYNIAKLESQHIDIKTQILTK